MDREEVGGRKRGHKMHSKTASGTKTQQPSMQHGAMEIIHTQFIQDKGADVRAINVLTPSADNLARREKAAAAFKVTSGWVHWSAVHMQPKTNMECRCLRIIAAQWAHKWFTLTIQLDLSGCFRALFGKLFSASPHDVCHNSTPAPTFAYDDRLNAAIYVQVA